MTTATAANPVAALDRMVRAGDPLAQKTVQRLFELGGVSRVSRILATRGRPRGTSPVDDETDEVLGEYLAATTPLPGWADEEKLRRAQTFFASRGLLAFTLLGCAALPQGYSIAMAARVLGFSRRLEDDADRRLRETCQFLMNAMGPGALHPGGRGLRTIQTVRLMHAAMRHLILEQPPATRAGGNRQISTPMLHEPWNAERDGLPINQAAMSGTVLSFSYVMLKGLRTLGIEVEPADEEAYLHRWNVIGHMMGVDDELLLPRPERFDDAERLFNALIDRYQGRCDDGVQLTAALIRYMEAKVAARTKRQRPPWPLGHLPRLLIYELVGPRTARSLDVRMMWIERAAVSLAIHVWHRSTMIKRLDHLLEHEKVAMTVRRLAAEWLFREMLDAIIEPSEGVPEFEIPQHLATGWNVNVPAEH